MASIPTSGASASSSPGHRCSSCGAPAKSRCSSCQKVRYCSRDCQRKEWLGHVVDCDNGRPITTADHLGAAVHRKSPPNDPQTSDDYGFAHSLTSEGQGRLLEIYTIVFRSGVKPRIVHQWQTSGELANNIRNLLSRPELKAQYSPGLWQWFLQNQHCFDRSLPNPVSFDTLAREMHLRTWRSIGGSTTETYERIEEIMSGWSEEKVTCFQFYLLGQLGGHPGPDQKLWKQFGFCACHEEDEGFLQRTYDLLKMSCTFDEYCDAYSKSQLIALMDAKGLRGRRLAHPYLEDVLENMPFSNKSVWDLKQFVVNPTPTETPRPVWADYGFMNCTSEDEKQELKQIYKELLEKRDANPLELHQACITGKLFDYMKRIVGFKKKQSKKFQRLMKNVYPLPEA